MSEIQVHVILTFLFDLICLLTFKSLYKAGNGCRVYSLRQHIVKHPVFPTLNNEHYL